MSTFSLGRIAGNRAASRFVLIALSVLVLFAGFVNFAKPAAAAPKWPVHRLGAAGDRVATLQRLLDAHGQVSVTVDGQFGPETERAVRYVQTMHRFQVDGVVGQRTWAVLTPYLRRGSQGPTVRALQEEFAIRGYGISVDGVFGPQMDAVVRAYQLSEGLVVDGIVGPNTWHSIVNGH